MLPKRRNAQKKLKSGNEIEYKEKKSKSRVTIRRNKKQKKGRKNPSKKIFLRLVLHDRLNAKKHRKAQFVL